MGFRPWEWFEKKWCRIGAVWGETGAEPEDSGTAEARIWDTGAESEQFAEKRCGTGAV